jgi:hypothetical protein
MRHHEVKEIEERGEDFYNSVVIVSLFLFFVKLSILYMDWWLRNGT